MGLTLLSQPAQAVVTVMVNSVNYDVTVFTGTYDANVSKFETAANGGLMPWFGNESLADQFALALYNLTPTNGGLTGNNPGPAPSDLGVGPLFAWSAQLESSPSGDITRIDNSAVSLSLAASGSEVGQLAPTISDGPSVFSYATATPVPVPFESDALPIIGSAIFMAGGMWAKRKFAKPLNKA